MSRRYYGAEFQSRFHWHLEALDIRHVYIRPRTPRLNGKVERSHRVDDQEFYQLLDKNGVADDIRLFNETLREWEDYYNYHRPHGALAGQTPNERLLAKTIRQCHRTRRTLHATFRLTKPIPRQQRRVSLDAAHYAFELFAAARG